MLEKSEIIKILKREMMEEFRLEIVYNSLLSMTTGKFIYSKCNITIQTSRYKIMIGYGSLSGLDSEIYVLGVDKITEFYDRMIEEIKHELYKVYIENKNKNSILL